MLEILGKPYILDHCYDYLKIMSEDTALKVYITDALKAVAENTGKMTQNGVVLKKRFYDFINDVPDEDENTKKRANGIIARIKSKLTELGKEDAQNG